MSDAFKCDKCQKYLDGRPVVLTQCRKDGSGDIDYVYNYYPSPHSKGPIIDLPDIEHVHIQIKIFSKYREICEPCCREIGQVAFRSDLNDTSN